MPLEMFLRQRISGGPPRVAISKYRNFIFNSACVTDHFKNVKSIHLLWDAEKLRVGIKPSNKEDRTAYPLHYSKRGNVASISAISFLRYIGWDMDSENTKHFDIEWNDRENFMEFTINEADRKPKRFSRLKKGD
jgi:hypothetical protein